MKRFYTDVGVLPLAQGHGIVLDGRPVRTPARALLALPSERLADAIAAEWRAQGDSIDARAMPLTGFANAAIDRVAPDRIAFAAGLSRYADSDLLAYRADGPPELVWRQAETYDPLLAWARSRYDIGVHLVVGINYQPQPRATLDRIASAYAMLGPFHLAGLHPVVTVCASAIIGLAVLHAEIDAAQALAAGQLEELWQIERWGADPVAEAAIAERRTALESAARFLATLALPG